MPCEYLSVTVANITNLKHLMKALDVMGIKYEVNQVGNAAILTSRNFSIDLTPQGAQIDRGDGNRKWVTELTNRYQAEAAKEVARRKGYFVKETTTGNGRIELSIRK